MVRKLASIVFTIVIIVSLPTQALGQTSVTKSVQISLPQPVTITKPITSPNPTGKQIPNPQLISSKTASTKIVDLGYALNETFDFNLDNGTNIHIAPGSITFRYKDNTIRAIILAGPVSGTPGTPNQQALTDAKNVLKEELDKSQMVVFSVNKDPSKIVRFNLSSEYDFQNFINLMQSSIVTGPFSIEQPNIITINPDPAKCYPTPCTTIILKKEGPTTTINDGDIKVTTTLPLKVENSKVSVDQDGQKETIISPGEAKRVVETMPLQKGILPTRIVKIGLTRCEPKPGPKPSCDDNSIVYQIETEKEARFLGVIPVKSKLDYQIDATNGKIVSETKPWYLHNIPFLFKL